MDAGNGSLMTDAMIVDGEGGPSIDFGVKCGDVACDVGEGCCVYPSTQPGGTFVGLCAPFGSCKILDGGSPSGQVACSGSAGCGDARVCCHRSDRNGMITNSTCDLAGACPGNSPVAVYEYIACRPGPVSECPAAMVCNVATSPVTRGFCRP